VFSRDGDTRWRPSKESTFRSYSVQPDPTDLGYHGKSIAAICTDANATYAKWLEHEADSLRRYIAWQTERVTSWTEQPLTPIKGALKDDKQGFKPTEPAY
jgi:hypothetical protein